MKRVYSVLSLTLFVLSIAALPSLAQDATPTEESASVPVAGDEATEAGEATPETTDTPITDLVYNSPVTGRIDNATPMQTWPLQTASADRLMITVERLDGNLIPDVVVLDATGTPVAQSFGADQTAARAIIENTTLPAAGAYQVQVTRDGGETGLTEGGYRLLVVPLATAADNVNNATIIGTIESDTPVEGEITATHWLHRYTFNAPAADTIRITAERISGNLLPEVEILDANNTAIQRGFLDDTGVFAQIQRLTLPSAGTYTIVVQRNSGFNGVTEGEYRLLVETTGAGPGNPSLQGVAGQIEYDTPLEGEITNARWYQDWTLSTQAGDRIAITVRRADSPAGGTLQPIVALLGGSGQELTRGYTANSGDRAQINPTTLQTPGTYTVRVLRQGEQTGVTTGAYTLEVSLIGSGVGSPEMAETAGEIGLVEPVEGEITNRRWAETWIFTGKAGEAIQITVQRTDGTLIPTLELRDANGQRITSAFYENTRDRSTLRYTLPGDGRYQIVVLRYNGQDGLTTGSYELSVQTAQ